MKKNTITLFLLFGFTSISFSAPYFGDNNNKISDPNTVCSPLNFYDKNNTFLNYGNFIEVNNNLETVNLYPSFIKGKNKCEFDNYSFLKNSFFEDFKFSNFYFYNYDINNSKLDGFNNSKKFINYFHFNNNEIQTFFSNNYYIKDVLLTNNDFENAILKVDNTSSHIKLSNNTFTDFNINLDYYNQAYFEHLTGESFVLHVNNYYSYNKDYFHKLGSTHINKVDLKNLVIEKENGYLHDINIEESDIYNIYSDIDLLNYISFTGDYLDFVQLKGRVYNTIDFIDTTSYSIDVNIDKIHKIRFKNSFIDELNLNYIKLDRLESDPYSIIKRINVNNSKLGTIYLNSDFRNISFKNTEIDKVRAYGLKSVSFDNVFFKENNQNYFYIDERMKKISVNNSIMGKNSLMVFESDYESYYQRPIDTIIKIGIGKSKNIQNLKFLGLYKNIEIKKPENTLVKVELEYSDVISSITNLGEQNNISFLIDEVIIEDRLKSDSIFCKNYNKNTFIYKKFYTYDEELYQVNYAPENNTIVDKNVICVES